MTAAARLFGLTLNDGWRVTEYINRSPYNTGGTFSHSYLATKGGMIAFVKAFDFSHAFEAGAETLAILNLLTASYEHERDVLEHCRARRLSNVAIAIDHGHVSVPGMTPMEGRVYYLLFEKADGDIRCQMDVLDAMDSVWCMRALRHVCLGLWQVHGELIAHQDIKPSNILSYGSEEFRIADFGRSSRRGYGVWYDNADIPGDRTYAPFELLYGFTHPDFIPRRVGSDLYMFGNLAAFLFTGVNVTEAVMAQLDPQHHFGQWGSDYATVLPYLQDAFGRFLHQVRPHLPENIRAYIVSLIQQLCNPDLSQRGHPRRLGRPNQYSLERYLSQLTHQLIRLEIRARMSRDSL